MRKLFDQMLDLFEMAVKPELQLVQGHLRREAVVELGERQTKFRPELLQSQLRKPDSREYAVGRAPHSRKIVHQSTRPIENDVPNHVGSLAEKTCGATGRFCSGLGTSRTRETCERQMVGAVRFELTTSCTRNKRASQATLRPESGRKLAGRRCCLQPDSFLVRRREGLRRSFVILGVRAQAGPVGNSGGEAFDN